MPDPHPIRHMSMDEDEFEVAIVSLATLDAPRYPFLILASMPPLTFVWLCC